MNQSHSEAQVIAAARTGSSPITTAMLLSLSAAIAFETLLFWSGFMNAYTVPKAVAALIGGAILLPQVCAAFLSGQPSQSACRLLRLAALQMLVITWATVNSLSPAVSFWGGDWRRMGWITQFAMATVAVSVPLAINGNHARWKFLLRILVTVGLICGIYGILQWLGWEVILPDYLREQITTQLGGLNRPLGTIGQPTSFANCLLYPFFAAVALLTCETSRTMRIIAAMTIIASGVGLTASRGALLAAAAGCGFFVFWIILSRLQTLNPAGRRLVTVTVILIIAGTLLFAVLSAHIWDPLSTAGYSSFRLASFGTDSESIGRIILWQDVIMRIVPHTWSAGTGPGMFRVAFAHYRSASFGAFGPDIHWENAHNIFLDRLTEQGVLGLIAFSALLGASALNLIRAIRCSSEWKLSAGYAAIGAGLIAAVTGNLFNGETIPTTYYLYIWIALSFAVCGSQLQRHGTIRAAPMNRLFQGLVGVFGISVSLFMGWYAFRNWSAEAALAEGIRSFNQLDAGKLSTSAQEAESMMGRVGTYHLEFANLMAAFLRENRASLTRSSQISLERAATDSALWAVDRTDEPMRALLTLISLADMTADTRAVKWLEQLKEIDPCWYRPHELSARLFLQQHRIEDALIEATIARQLAPFVQSTEGVWRSAIMLRRQAGTDPK